MRNKISTIALLSGLVASGLITPAVAQEVEDSDEIVVTAQHREQRLQDVPIAVSALTAESIEDAGLTTMESLPAAVPGLQIQRVTGGASPFIRGVGSSNTGLGTSRAVGLYVDDVYINAAGANVFNLNNIAQIDVLKGPQGTLFGRNATGGVMQVRTRAPGSDPGVDLTLGVANFDTLSGSLYADTRLTDAWAVNFAASVSDQGEGWGTNVTTGEEIYQGDYYALRGQALYDTADTSLRLIADYYEANEDFGYNKQALPGTVNTGGGTYLGEYLTTLTTPDDVTNQQWGLSANFEQQIGDLSFVSITAYRYSNFDATLDQEGSPPQIIQAIIPSVTDSFSQEFRLQSPDEGNFTWILGAFFYDENAEFDPLHIAGSSQAANGGFINQYSRQELNSWSVFGDATFQLTPRARISAGLRYTSDEYSERTRTDNASGVTFQPLLEQGDTFDKLTYRLVADYRVTDDILAYASYSRGFRSGGFVLTAPRDPILRPEVIDATEIGLKSEFFDNRLRVNLGAFHYDYTDLQVSVIQGGLVTSINAAAATINGAEIEIVYHATDNLDFNISASSLDSAYDSFPAGQLFLPRPATCAPTPTILPGAPTGGNLQCPVDLAGYPTPQAPEFTANVGVTYDRDTSVGNFRLSTNYYYNDGFYFGSDGRGLQDGYSLLNASLLWTAPSEHYDVRFWGNNLLDEYYYTNISHGSFGDQGSPASPLTYGVTLGYHF